MAKISGLPVMLAFLLLILPGCSEYRKGDMYYSAITGDTISYVIQKAGKGEGILELAKEQEKKQLTRRNEVKLIVINDSSTVVQGKSILLVNTEMPDFEDDMLSKGYMGAFGSKMIVHYVVVSYNDFNRYFKPVPDEREK